MIFHFAILDQCKLPQIEMGDHDLRETLDEVVSENAVLGCFAGWRLVHNEQMKQCFK